MDYLDSDDNKDFPSYNDRDSYPDFYRDEQELEQKDKRRLYYVLEAGSIALFLILAAHFGEPYLNKLLNERFKKNSPDTTQESMIDYEEEDISSMYSSQEAAPDINVDNSSKEVESLTAEQKENKKTTSEPDDELANLLKVKDIDERAEALAKFYSDTGAYSTFFAAYDKESAKKIISIMNGDLEVDSPIRAEANIYYLTDYFRAIENSRYHISQNTSQGDTVKGFYQPLDLTDTILNDRDCKTYQIVDYLDYLRQAIMHSNSKKEIYSLCENFFVIIANMTYGQGFSMNGECYTIDDFKGTENNGIASVLMQCVWEAGTYAEKVNLSSVSYTNEKGLLDEVEINSLLKEYRDGGLFYNSWAIYLKTSMLGSSKN